MKPEDLIGKWKIERKIFDARVRAKGKMRGMGVFHAQNPGELIYHEQLWHETPAETFHLARKSYRFLFTEEALDIYFHREENERLFLTLSPLRSRMKAAALCGSDRYQLTWKWEAPDQFHQRFRVKGEKKNYLIESRFNKCD